MINLILLLFLQHLSTSKVIYSISLNWKNDVKAKMLNFTETDPTKSAFIKSWEKDEYKVKKLGKSDRKGRYQNDIRYLAFCELPNISDVIAYRENPHNDNSKLFFTNYLTETLNIDFESLKYYIRCENMANLEVPSGDKKYGSIPVKGQSGEFEFTIYNFMDHKLEFTYRELAANERFYFYYPSQAGIPKNITISEESKEDYLAYIIVIPMEVEKEMAYILDQFDISCIVTKEEGPDIVKRCNHALSGNIITSYAKKLNKGLVNRLVNTMAGSTEKFDDILHLIFQTPPKDVKTAYYKYIDEQITKKYFPKVTE